MPSPQSQTGVPSRMQFNNLDGRSTELFIFGAPRQRSSERRQERERSSRSRRQHRRITGYHNVFDELAPPDYDVFGASSSESAVQPPPEYECTVELSDIMEIIWERTSPFQPPQMSPWQAVHVTLRGTMLQVSTAKTHGLLTPAWKRGRPTGEAGRRIRTYTLQHAEVGLASDHKKVEMVPKSPIAQLLPESALKQLQETDPSQFDIIYNYIARLRVEGEQILLRFKDSEHRMSWIEQICAAIDISLPLEVRTEPRNHTLPRRRRRHDVQRVLVRTNPSGRSVAPASLVQEQERILREHYPHLMRSARQETQQTEQPNEPRSPRAQGDDDDDRQDADAGEADQNADNDNEPDPDYGDLDLAFMRDPTSDNDPEDDERHLNNMSNLLGSIGQQQSTTTRRTGQHSNLSSPSSSPHLNNAGFLGPNPLPRAVSALSQQPILKWNPRIPRNDALRDARYRRRCMPMLVHNSRYAQNVIIHKGKRKVIDWHNRKLVLWPAEPPSYHDVLYGPARMDPTKDGEEGVKEARERARENLPPGAGNAVMRLRGLLRRHASSGEMDVNHSDGYERTQRRPRNQRSVTFQERSSSNQDMMRSDGGSALINTYSATRRDEQRRNVAQEQTTSADSTPSATTVNTSTSAEYPSSGDDHSYQGPPLDDFSPPVIRKASNSTAFSRKLRQKFGRKSVTNINEEMVPRAATRAGDREDGVIDEKQRAQLTNFRTASSLDVSRTRI